MTMSTLLAATTGDVTTKALLAMPSGGCAGLAGHAGPDDLDDRLLPDRAVRPEAVRLRSDSEADRRAPRADPPRARRGRRGPRGSAQAARGAPQADRRGAR